MPAGSCSKSELPDHGGEQPQGNSHGVCIDILQPIVRGVFTADPESHSHRWKAGAGVAAVVGGDRSKDQRYPEVASGLIKSGPDWLRGRAGFDPYRIIEASCAIDVDDQRLEPLCSQLLGI